jgi:hypothetical protein
MPILPSRETTSSPRLRHGALLLVLACGLALRVANARTAVVHGDEEHYAGDAMWSLSPLGASERLHFLYNHPHEHPRLDPTTGERTRWGANGGVARLGHPSLFAGVAGAVFALTKPATLGDAVFQARLVNAVADTVAIGLVAVLTSRLGGGPATALLAAGLYAVFPPAATYGSLAYPDAFMAPLLLLVLIAVAGGRWLAAGLATGLLLATKQSGAVALVLVPVLWAVSPGRRTTDVVRWALATLLVASTLVNPAAWIDSIRHPSRPVGVVQTDPLRTLAGNVDAVARPSTYYWLSFAHHGRPPAPLLAHANQLVTPAYLSLYAVGLVAALGRGRTRRLAFLYVPALLALAFVLPSNGMWRLHFLFPLVCAAAAGTFAEGPRALGIIALAVGLLGGASSLLPQAPGPHGEVTLGDLLFMNPGLEDRTGFYDRWRPLVVRFRPGGEARRSLWVAPGRYRLTVQGTGRFDVAVDDRDVVWGGMVEGELTLAGRLHELRIVAPNGGELRELVMAPVDRR